MVVVVLFVLAYVAFRAIARDNDEVQYQSPSDYQAAVSSGLDAVCNHNQLQGWAPSSPPRGWRLINQPSYTSDWHLGLTDGTGYLVVEEGLASRRDVTAKAIQGEETPAGKVTINGKSWSAYTYPHGGYAVSRAMEAKIPRYKETLVVAGGAGATPAQVRDFAASLKPAECTSAD